MTTTTSTIDATALRDAVAAEIILSMYRPLQQLWADSSDWDYFYHQDIAVRCLSCGHHNDTEAIVYLDDEYGTDDPFASAWTCSGCGTEHRYLIHFTGGVCEEHDGAGVAQLWYTDDAEGIRHFMWFCPREEEGHIVSGAFTASQRKRMR